MFIQAEPPLAITKDLDGAQHAVRDAIQVTVTADLGKTILPILNALLSLIQDITASVNIMFKAFGAVEGLIRTLFGEYRNLYNDIYFYMTGVNEVIDKTAKNIKD